MSSGTLLLSRADVERLLTPDACIAAVEDAVILSDAANGAPLAIMDGRGNPIHFILRGAFR